jgi:hypothetical protein
MCRRVCLSARGPDVVNGGSGFPHGMPATQAETINADLLAFLASVTST